MSTLTINAQMWQDHSDKSVNSHVIKNQLFSIVIDESLSIISVAETTQEMKVACHIFSLHRG